MLSILNKKVKVAVHSGSFHPDDVCAVAILSLYTKSHVKVFRTRDPKVWATCDYVCDVGGEYDPAQQKFDHHQTSYDEKRENSIAYSSAGLVWKEYGEKICGSKKVAEKINKDLIQPIDADDTGVNLCTLTIPSVHPFFLTDAIYAMYPTWRESKTLDAAFAEAVIFLKKILEREIKVAQDKIAAETIVHDIYEKSADKRIIIFDTNLPKSSLADYPEPLFVVHPEKESSSWRVGTIRKDEQGFEVRKTFPATWAAKTGDELFKITGVTDATFCHRSCVYAGAKSKEGAIALAKLAMKEGE